MRHGKHLYLVVKSWGSESLHLNEDDARRWHELKPLYYPNATSQLIRYRRDDDDAWKLDVLQRSWAGTTLDNSQMASDIEALCTKHGITMGWLRGSGSPELHAIMRRLDAAEADAARLRDLLAKSEARLDAWLPAETCAACRRTFRVDMLVPEEGDRWECEECNRRLDEQERAAARGAP